MSDNIQSARKIYSDEHHRKSLIYQKRYEIKHADEIRERRRLFRIAHKEDNHKYYLEHREDILKCRHEKHQECRERKLAYKCIYDTANKEEKDAAYKHTYYEANKGKLKPTYRAHYIANREKILAYQTAYYSKNKEIVSNKHRLWQKEHSGKCSVYANRRRALKRNTKINDLTTDQWKERIDEFRGYCAYCLKPMKRVTQDHMTPLSRNGNHTLDNVVPCCWSCNSKKYMKTLLEFVSNSA